MTPISIVNVSAKLPEMTQSDPPRLVSNTEFLRMQQVQCSLAVGVALVSPLPCAALLLMPWFSEGINKVLSKT